MRAALIVLILGLAATSVMSACAGANYLTTHFGIPATSMITEATGPPAVTPTTLAADPQICGLAATNQICLPEASLATNLKGYIETKKTQLETLAGNRDTYIIDQRGEVIKALDSLKKINEFVAKDIPTGYEVIVGEFLGYATQIAKNFTEIVENFEDYQEERAKCMQTLLQTQVALLCDSIKQTVPTTITLTGNGAVTLNDALITSVNTACYTYISYSERQSAIISASIFSSGLSSLASALEKAKGGDNSGAAKDIESAYTEFAKGSYSGDNEKKASEIPSTCTTSPNSCATWIDGTLIAATGILSNDAAILGGTAVTKPTFVKARVLNEGNERRLAGTGANTYNPTLGNLGFDLVFDKNPAGIDYTKNSKSALRNGIIACAVAALALVF